MHGDICRRQLALDVREVRTAWPDAEPLGHQDQIGTRLRRHLVHHVTAMLLYRFLGDAKLEEREFVARLADLSYNRFVFPQSYCKSHGNRFQQQGAGAGFVPVEKRIISGRTVSRSQRGPTQHNRMVRP
jgi:hypothetical protein